MLIRSQNLLSIVVLNGCDSICIEKVERSREMAIYAYNGSAEDGVLLGVYSSRGKALKVLDEIQEKYCIMAAADCTLNGIETELRESAEIIDNCIAAIRKVYVFQMPEDSEV